MSRKKWWCTGSDVKLVPLRFAVGVVWMWCVTTLLVVAERVGRSNDVQGLMCNHLVIGGWIEDLGYWDKWQCKGWIVNAQKPLDSLKITCVLGRM